MMRDDETKRYGMSDDARVSEWPREERICEETTGKVSEEMRPISVWLRWTSNSIGNFLVESI